MNYRKKLIEVAIPLEAINVASAREKSIRHGHPSTLHLWWARRPLAACRAVLFASLVDDPDSDPTFRKADGSVDEERAGYRRAELFNLIEELVLWENSNNESVLNRARAEIAASVASRKIHDTKEWSKDKVICGEKAWAFVCRTAKPQNVSAFLTEHAPPVLDPFCGGGSIPLEAQRLGLRAYGSDLNPVPVLITKALIEIPPKFAGKPPVNSEANARLKDGWKNADGIAEDVRYYGKWMRDEAEKRIGQLYPRIKITAAMAKDREDLKPYVGQELTAIAWLWARTVASPNPAVSGAHVPLVRSFWLSTKKGKEAWIERSIDRKNNTYRFDVRVGMPGDKSSVDAGTKIGRGCKFKCLLSDQPIAEAHIKNAGKRDELGQRLLAIVADGSRGRVYLSPTDLHEQIATAMNKPRNISAIEAPLANDPRNLWCLGYGLDRFDKLFTNRQLTALIVFSDLVGEARAKVLADAKTAGTFRTDDRPLDASGAGGTAYADAVATYLAFGLSKASNLWSSICGWMSDRGAMRETFAREAIPMMWDYAEANPFSESGGSFEMFIERIADGVAHVPAAGFGSAQQLDATAATVQISSFAVCTDPPYYDNIGYADLSDFFYVWLRRTLAPIYPSLFATVLTPKSKELIATPYRHDGSATRARDFFEDGFTKTFTNIQPRQDRDVPLPIFYAFKQSEDDETGDVDQQVHVSSTGWETMLEGIVRSGFAVSGTWPMRTESPGRAVALGTNALASSIVLSCRPRPSDAPMATRREFLNALKRELPEALKHLQRGNIAPVDLAQASIGPGMAVFTRYSKVMEADGSSMKVRQALALINHTLDDVLAEQEGEFDTDTRWALAWFEQFGMEEGAFGIAETLSKAKNAAVNGLQEAGIIKARSGKVRLLKRDEMNADWNPATDKRLTSWEVTQHLIRVLDTGGETAAADLLRRLGGVGEVARDLAYRLYSICERKKWTDEALAYNSLVIAWPELSRFARSAPVAAPAKQTELF